LGIKYQIFSDFSKFNKKIYFVKVIGVELNEKALEQFFFETEIKYTVEEIKDFKIYKVKYK